MYVAAAAGTATLDAVEHLLDGQVLYIPGYHPDGGAANFTPTQPTQLRSHPTSCTQLPILAGQLDTLISTEAVFVCLSHLAHHGCPKCADIWDSARTWPTNAPAMFTHHPLTDAGHLVLHCDDRPL
jgi:hypothetical protein